MIVGSLPGNRKCTFCQRYVFEVDALWEEGEPYHEPCYRQMLSRQIAKLDKKARFGNLTLIEAKEVAEMVELFMKLRKAPVSENVRDLFVPERPIFQGNTLLALTHKNPSLKLPRKENATPLLSLKKVLFLENSSIEKVPVETEVVMSTDKERINI